MDGSSTKRYYSTLSKNNNNNKSLTEVESKFNAKSSTFLSNVSSILSENKDNPYNAELMPLFSVLFFILCLANCGTPLTLNFVGEFMSLYGAFERLPILGALAASSIVLSAAYTIYMFNRIAFGGSFSKFFEENISDVNKREFFILFILVSFTVLFGIYPSFILDGLHYSVSTLIYSIS